MGIDSAVLQGQKTAQKIKDKISRRTLRKDKTQYIYSMENTKGIYYNEAKHGVFFVPREYS